MKLCFNITLNVILIGYIFQPISRGPVNRKTPIYFKTSYGGNDPSSSKKVYCPIKQEKISQTSTLNKKLKVDEDDTEAKAKEVREMLQSIMGLTYKVISYI